MKSSKIRRNRPLFYILILDIVIVGVIWTFFETTRQNKVLGSIAIQLLAGIVGLSWFAFFSEYSRAIRFKITAGVLIVMLLLASLFEIREVSGDVAPVLVWRWSSKHYETLGGLNDTGIGVSVDFKPRSEESYPRFLGPDGNAMLTHALLSRNWSASPPKELWRIPIGAGWSAFSVVGNLAVTQEQRGEQEHVTCYDANSGKPLWSYGVPAVFTSFLAGDGPRATPAIEIGEEGAGLVYALGATGVLNCIELTTGRLVWSKDVKELGGELPEYGYSGSPLVVNDKVVVSIGGADGKSLVAFNRYSGDFIWGGGSAAAAYSSPQFRVLAGVPQIILLYRQSVTGHDPESGAILWREPWGKGTPSVANPLVIGPDSLLVSSGYGFGCKRYDLEQKDSEIAVTVRYESPRLKAKFANYVIFDGFVYGLDDGVLVCLDPESGERMWKKGRYGHGQMLLAGDLLLVQGEDGVLHLIEPNPESLTELGSLSVLDGKAWNNLALAGNRLYLRNHREAVCLELPVRAD